MKEPHNSISVEESKELHASGGDKDKRDADRSAVNKAGDSRIKKKCQDEKATGNGKASHKRQLRPCTDITNLVITTSEISCNCSLKAKINKLL